MRFPRYKTKRAARLAVLKHKSTGSRFVIRLADGRFTHLPVAVGADMMAAIVAKACRAKLVDTVHRWTI